MLPNSNEGSIETVPTKDQHNNPGTLPTTAANQNQQPNPPTPPMSISPPNQEPPLESARPQAPLENPNTQNKPQINSPRNELQATQAFVADQGQQIEPAILAAATSSPSHLGQPLAPTISTSSRQARPIVILCPPRHLVKCNQRGFQLRQEVLANLSQLALLCQSQLPVNFNKRVLRPNQQSRDKAN